MKRDLKRYIVVPGDILMKKVKIGVTYERERKGDWDGTNGRFLR